MTVPFRPGLSSSSSSSLINLLSSLSTSEDDSLTPSSSVANFMFRGSFPKAYFALSPNIVVISSLMSTNSSWFTPILDSKFFSFIYFDIFSARSLSMLMVAVLGVSGVGVGMTAGFGELRPLPGTSICKSGTLFSGLPV